MSIQQLPARAQQAKPSFSGSLPGFPDSAFSFCPEDGEDDSLPLPDHFPEPVADPDPPASLRTSAVLETGQTLIYCSAQDVVKKPDGGGGIGGGGGGGGGGGCGANDDHGDVDAKQAVKRITDKYAAPGTLLRNGSTAPNRNSSSSNNAASSPHRPSTLPPSPPVNAKNTLPASPTPSITLSSTSSPCVPVTPPFNPFPAFHLNGDLGPVPNSVTYRASPSRAASLGDRASSTHSGGMLTPDSATRLSSGKPVPSPKPPRTPSPRSCVASSTRAFSEASADLSSEPCSSPRSTLLSEGSVCGAAVVGGGGLLGVGRYQSVSGLSLSSGGLGEGVTDQDIQQVEMFYKSHKSDVVVCRSLANLYLGSASPSSPASVSATNTTTNNANAPPSTPSSSSNSKNKTKKNNNNNNNNKNNSSSSSSAASSSVSSSTVNRNGIDGGVGGGGEGGKGPSVSSAVSGSDSWEYVSTGIPLLVLDSGDHLRARQLSVVLAEKGTGFSLWKDVVSHLTRYSCLHASFHTLRFSSDPSKLAGLSFDDSKAAADFAASVLQLTSDPEDELLMLSKKGKKKKKKKAASSADGKKSGKYRPPKKTDISQPCCFQHVTKLERPQISSTTVPLPPNAFPPAPSGSVSSLSDVFHDRLSVSLALPRARSQSSELSEASSAAHSDL